MDYGLDMFLQEHLICSFIHVHRVTAVVSKILALAPTYVHLFTPIVLLICSANATEKVFIRITTIYCALISLSNIYIYIAVLIGILCGSCRNNSGVTVLLNKCTSCSHVFGTLVGVLGSVSYYMVYRNVSTL